MSNDYIPQSSASDRYDAARKALAGYDAMPDDYDAYDAMVHPLADALRALITPPGVGESEEQIAARIRKTYEFRPGDDWVTIRPHQFEAALTEAIRAGIQDAHETWECEDRPTQGQMLRWLGLDYQPRATEIFIPSQSIDREDD